MYTFYKSAVFVQQISKRFKSAAQMAKNNEKLID